MFLHTLYGAFLCLLIFIPASYFILMISCIMIAHWELHVHVYVPVLLHCGAVSGGINIINRDGAILLNSSTFTG